MSKFNEVEYMAEYERGELRGNKVIELFSHLIKTGKLGKLDWTYRKFSASIILRGFLSTTGEILKIVGLKKGG